MQDKVKVNANDPATVISNPDGTIAYVNTPMQTWTRIRICGRPIGLTGCDPSVASYSQFNLTVA
jgi:hypothetical protein